MLQGTIDYCSLEDEVLTHNAYMESLYCSRRSELSAWLGPQGSQAYLT